ncbi:hypothetical protein BD769DRAFT_1393058 [Suillus cothurnatus]|nr:hypothetical protein BD769DRAFT_1393058 [Suillus cothurnatus]
MASKSTTGLLLDSADIMSTVLEGILYGECCIIHLEDGLVKYGNTFPDRPAGFFADVTEQTFLIKNTFTNSAWRWSGALGICMVYAQAPSTNARNVFGNKTGHWIVTFLSLTLASNLLSSEFIKRVGADPNILA